MSPRYTMIFSERGLGEMAVSKNGEAVSCQLGIVICTARPDVRQVNDTTSIKAFKYISYYVIYQCKDN
jgi:hypothetical protein